MAVFPDKANPGPAADKSYDSRERLITPSDTVKLTSPINALRIGGDGDVVFVSPDGTVNTITCTAGETVLMEAVQIKATGTTATPLHGISSKALR